MTKIKIKKESRYHGTAMVEAALVLSLLLYVTLGTIEYGWLLLKDHHITNAARHAARIAIRPDATNQQVVDTIDDLMDKAGMTGSGYITEIPDVTSISTGDSLTIEITVPCGNIAIFNAPLLLPIPQTIGATVTMTKEGPYVISESS